MLNMRSLTTRRTDRPLPAANAGAHALRFDKDNQPRPTAAESAADARPEDYQRRMHPTRGPGIPLGSPRGLLLVRRLRLS